MGKEFICLCGRMFDNPQAFNGHKGHCKEHQLNKYGNLDNYNKNKEGVLDNQVKCVKTISERTKRNKELKLTTWVNEKHICEKIDFEKLDNTIQ